MKALTKLRHEYKDLQADSEFEIIYAEADEFPFVYKRGDLIVAINPSDKKTSATLPKNTTKVFEIGETEIKDASLHMQPQSFVVLR